MKNAVFIGSQGALAKAYPAGLRKELAERFAFPIAEQTKESAGRADLREIEVIFGTWGMPSLDGKFLAAAPKLRVVFYAAGTIKNFATKEAFERGITFCSAWQANALPVAEYTLSVILLSLKKFWQAARESRQAKIDGFEGDVPGAYRTKIGLVSLGAIGLRVTELLRPFEVEVMACDPHCDAERANAAEVRLVPLEQLFRECDVVSIHAPLLPQTVKMINVALVQSMKAGATLINTARGAVIDEDPVLEVFRDRKDLTAILDVTIHEPPVESSLVYKLSNVIYTPHIAGSKGGEIARMGDWMAQEARRFLAGEPLRHQITFEMLDRAA